MSARGGLFYVAGRRGGERTAHNRRDCPNLRKVATVNTRSTEIVQARGLAICKRCGHD